MRIIYKGSDISYIDQDMRDSSVILNSKELLTENPATLVVEGSGKESIMKMLLFFIIGILLHLVISLIPAFIIFIIISSYNYVIQFSLVWLIMFILSVFLSGTKGSN